MNSDFKSHVLQVELELCNLESIMIISESMDELLMIVPVYQSVPTRGFLKKL